MGSVFLLSALSTCLALPGGFKEIAGLTPPDGAVTDRFGASVDVWGDTLVVGSPRHDAAGSEAGAVYVFERNLGGPNAWGLAEKLLSPWPDPESNYFGQEVALDGDTLAVGAPYLEDGTGGVFVYERGVGGFALIAVNQGELDDLLGWSLDLEGDTLVAGAPDDCNVVYGNCIPSERAVVYGRDQGGPGAWGELQVLPTQADDDCDRFGWDVDLDGDTLFVGAPVIDCTLSPFLSNSGSARVYDRDGSTFAWEAELPPVLDVETRELGKQVALDGERVAIVGYRILDLDGEVHVWERSPPGGPWQGVARIRGPQTPTLFTTYGDSLLLRKELLLVGHPMWEWPVKSGRVWIYRRTPAGNWSFGGPLYPVDSQPTDYFGESMALSGSILVVGAPGHTTGAAHVFVIGQSDPWENLTPAEPPGG